MKKILIILLYTLFIIPCQAQFPKWIVTAFDVKHGKPNPEPYLIGMQKCGVEPWETMVVENAPLGVRAAVAARCFTIAVNTGPLPDEMLQKEGANLTFPRMTDLAEAYHCWYPSVYRAE